MNSNNRIAATLFPRDIVCLRNIRINTLHKGDDDDDDDDNNNNRCCCCSCGIIASGYTNSKHLTGLVLCFFLKNNPVLASNVSFPHLSQNTHVGFNVITKPASQPYPAPVHNCTLHKLHMFYKCENHL